MLRGLIFPNDSTTNNPMQRHIGIRAIDGMRLIFASALLLFPLHAQAAPSVPNDCWSGVMTPDKAPHGQFVAIGPVAQWGVGMPLVVYPTRENFEQIIALAKKRADSHIRHVTADYGYSHMDFRAGAGRQGLGRR